MAIFRKKDEGEEPGRSDAASGAPQAAGGLSREMRREMKKREGAADRLRRPTTPKKKRTKAWVFVKEVRGELARVAWPTRSEVLTYTVVVVVTVSFFMVIIGAIDWITINTIFSWIIEGGK